MKKTISIKLLKEIGYIEYENHSGDLGNRFFQKRVADEKGIKYFIGCNFTKLTKDPRSFRFWDFSISIETEKGGVEIQTIQWFNQDGIYSQRTIREAEEYLEKMWIANGSNYHKRY
jgi:hypothetical protein